MPSLAVALCIVSSGTLAARLRVTAAGVAGIHANTVANVPTIRKLFPRCEVKKGHAASEGEITGDEFNVGCEGEELLSIVTDGVGTGRLYSVVIRSSEVTAEGDLRVGASLALLLNRPDVRDCEGGFEETAELGYCRLKTPNVWYEFDRHDEKGEPIANPFKLRPADSRRILRIIWHPRRLSR